MFSLTQKPVDSVRLIDLTERTAAAVYRSLPEEFGGVIRLDMSFDSIISLSELIKSKDVSIYEQINHGLSMLLLEYDHTDLSVVEQEALLFELLDIAFGKKDDGSTDFAEELDIGGNTTSSKRDVPLDEDEFDDLYDDDDDDEFVPDNSADYSLKQDAKYIYSSFMKDYGINLIEEQGKLSWFEFIALLEGLSEDTKFMKVVKYRKMKLPRGNGSSDERRQIRELKRKYALRPE